MTVVHVAVRLNSAYRQVVKILREEWDMQEGETVLGYLQNIAELEG